MDEDQKDVAIGCLLGVLELFLVTPLAYIWDGVVLRLLWRWFVVPYFDLPALSIPLAIGVAIIVAFLTARYTPLSDKDVDKGMERATRLVYIFVLPAICLFAGWIVQMFL